MDERIKELATELGERIKVIQDEEEVSKIFDIIFFDRCRKCFHPKAGGICWNCYESRDYD